MKNPALVLGAGFLFFVCASSRAQTPTLQRNEPERQLFDLLNRERAENHLPALRWNDALFKAARKHALLMANLNLLEHQLPSEPDLEERLAATGARFSVIAENIAFGQNPETIHKGWMDSPGHRKNILNPRITAVGIAAVHGTAGFFAVQDFSALVDDLNLEQQEQKVVSLLAAEGFRGARASDSARKSCDRDGFADGGAKEWIRFEAPDLNTLPEEIVRKMRGAPFTKAAVGACRGSNAPGFSRYRIVIVFF